MNLDKYTKKLAGDEPIASFEGDLKKITEIQQSFLQEAKDFIYFRKGEFDNVVLILQDVLAYLTNNPEIIFVAISAYPGAKIIIRDTKGALEKHDEFVKNRKAKNEITFRIISSATPENKKELREFEKMGVGVCIIPDEIRGRIRFFVNEKRFCLFLRQAEDNFFGIIGKDKLMIKRLRELFDREYIENKV